MNIEIPTAHMQMSDGSTLFLLLCKDPEKLDGALAHIETIDLGGDQYLIHRPGLSYRWITEDQEAGTQAHCLLCNQPVLHWSNKSHQRLHCGCTIWVLPLEVEETEDIDTAGWMITVNSAERGIQGWLQQN